jgi:hypothetical protein
MNRINEYHIEPGTYTDENNHTIVVLDVVNHLYNTTAQLPEAIADPLVICRQLIENNKEHQRIAFPISVFKTIYKKS